ncbi:MAG TPA: carbonic anhydrase family protein [Candidatus Angelobacter sp.]|nr:carbonic anhydrase family protein [Candidatus Angelobacter sp.]
MFCAVMAVSQEHESWDYSKAHGPKHWSEVSALCGTGHSQSPINIVSATKTQLPALEFSYQAAPANVINNGHTVQENYAPGSDLVFQGKTYELVQFHFHHISETAIKGKHAPLEVHLVHKDKDGNLLVVAVLLDEGAANPAVASVFANIGPEKGKANTPSGVTVNAAQLLPEKRNYYTFTGSLTTPPCSENVTWVVMVNPMTVSKGQIDAFAKLYPHDARPVQPLDGRKVQESE